MDIDPSFPEVTKQQRAALLEIRQTLELQAPHGAHEPEAAPEPTEVEAQDGHGPAAPPAPTAV
jgi:hypothetical protein